MTGPIFLAGSGFVAFALDRVLADFAGALLEAVFFAGAFARDLAAIYFNLIEK